MSEDDPKKKRAEPLPDPEGDDEVIQLDGFFLDPDGGLRRGVPTWVIGKDGEDIPVFLEFNTDMVFPREVPPPKASTPPKK